MKAEDIEKLAEEAAKKEFPDSQFSDADIWNRKCFISGYKAAQSDLEENATCACGDVFNKNFKGICPNCVAAQVFLHQNRQRTVSRNICNSRSNRKIV